MFGWRSRKARPKNGPGSRLVWTRAVNSPKLALEAVMDMQVRVAAAPLGERHYKISGGLKFPVGPWVKQRLLQHHYGIQLRGLEARLKRFEPWKDIQEPTVRLLMRCDRFLHELGNASSEGDKQ